MSFFCLFFLNWRDIIKHIYFHNSNLGKYMVNVNTAIDNNVQQLHVITSDTDRPILRSSSASSSRAPANTSTKLVPSPTSCSCMWDAITIILAAGCCTLKKKIKARREEIINTLIFQLILSRQNMMIRRESSPQVL